MGPDAIGLVYALRKLDELVGDRDDKLALLNGGDELALAFRRASFRQARRIRARFLLHVVGWDKDADFHVGRGWSVDPFPFRGMDDQSYGRRPRPACPDDGWIGKYNTRWVGPMILKSKPEVTRAGDLKRP